jgi:hypothetical protein
LVISEPDSILANGEIKDVVIEWLGFRVVIRSSKNLDKELLVHLVDRSLFE